MVAFKDICASNALINDATGPRVAVFAGATTGIGKYTVRALVEKGFSIRLYLIGRKSSTAPMRDFIQALSVINAKAEIFWLEGEISLLAETKRLCDAVKAKESRIDLLFLSAGYAPFGSRKETSEGIEIAQSLEVYSRLLFILQLLPLLSAAESPRVVSVMAGGLERAGWVKLDDLDLREPGNFSALTARPQYATMHTMALDKLAVAHPNLTFIHSWPGWVDTGNVKRGGDPNSAWDWFRWLVLDPLIRIVSYLENGEEVTGQRHLFQCTSAYYGGKGITWTGEPGLNTREQHETGFFLANFRCTATPNTKQLRKLRENEQEIIWKHCQEVVRPYL